MKGKLYLIPTTLGDFETIKHVMPSYNLTVIHSLKYFIVENLRTARRFISRTTPPYQIDDLNFYELGKHNNPEQVSTYLGQAEQGHDMGLLSEAGTPCIADPGAVIVKMAQQKGIEVVPLVGPNSIILALMGSGFNGQSFVFHGYLPVDLPELNRKIKEMESAIKLNNQTQVFIEAPFRNNKLFDSLLKTCHPQTSLCIAVDLTLNGQKIMTRTIAAWKHTHIDLHKKPAVFLLYKQ